MTSIHIQLLDNFVVTADGQAINTFRSDKVRALLAYVAAAPERTHGRLALATLLWPMATDATAKANLRVALSNLRKVVPDALAISRQQVQLQPTVTVDVGQMQAAIANGDAKTAVASYAGVFLRGFVLEDSAEFDDWITITRENLHLQMMQACDRLLQQLAQQQEWDASIRFAKQQLQHEPWHEPAHRAIMQAHAAQGNQQAALAQYATCVEVLADELGAEPSAITQALFEGLHSAETKTKPKHNLPAQTTPLIGRSVEVRQVVDSLREQRLVTLLGMGGVGKTRIGLHAASQLMDHFADGVWFVPLVALPPVHQVADNVAIAILSALNRSLTGSQPPIQQLTAQLSDQSLLLVLDNIEQLADTAADFLLPLLNETSVHILLTSRAQVNLPAEQVLRIGGLALADAVTLFNQRAAIQPDDGAAVQRICRLVQGLPLGIELAAHWTQHFEAAELADEIANNPAALTKDQSRQGSLTGILEHSWGYLSPLEQTTLAQLSVFRGGFGRKAFLAVTGASLTELTGLIYKSLVQPIAAGRYQLHEVVREFSAEKHTLSPTKAASRHATHYLSTANHLNATWFGDNLAAPLAIAERDWRNFEAAWQHAVARADWSGLASFAQGVRNLYRFRVLYEAGAGRFAQAITSLEPLCEDQAVQQRALGQLYAAQAWFLVQQRNHAAAEQAIERALALADATEQSLLWLDAQVSHQILLTQQNKLAESEQLAETVIARAEAHGSAFYAGEARNDYGFVQLLQARYVEAEATLAQAEADYRAANDVYGTITALRNQGIALMMQERIADSAEKLNLGVALARQRQDPEREIFILSLLSNLSNKMGDYGAAFELAHRQVDYARRMGLHADLSVALINSALPLLHCGLYARAISIYSEALPLVEQHESATHLSGGLIQRGICASEQGDFAAARRYMLRAKTLADEIPNLRFQVESRTELGYACMTHGAWEEASRNFKDAQQLASAQPPRGIYWRLLIGEARCALVENRPDDARKLVSEVRAQDDSHPFTNAIELYFNIYCLYADLSETQLSSAYLKRAYELMRKRADKISNPEFRESYLRNVALHRDITEAWQKIA